MDATPFYAGDFVLQSGEVLYKAEIAYKTYGELLPDRSNVVVMFTPFGGRHSDIEWMVGASQALDPAKYFIIIPNMLGNGLSSSPSREPWTDRRSFPLVTPYDNVLLQRRLLAEVFGIERIQLAVGWSMGGQQAYHWAAIFPDQVDRLVCLCGSARTSRHNYVFLEGVRAALEADPAYQDGWFTGAADRGLKAASFAFAAWALSQTFYREEVDRTLGFASLPEFLRKNWQEPYALRNPNDLRAMIRTWQSADISNNDIYRKDFPRALDSVRAKALIMPSETDLYFPAADSALEVASMRQARLLPIPSIWGHRAGNNAKNPVDAAFVNHAIAEFLRE